MVCSYVLCTDYENIVRRYDNKDIVKKVNSIFVYFRHLKKSEQLISTWLLINYDMAVRTNIFDLIIDVCITYDENDTHQSTVRELLTR